MSLTNNSYPNRTSASKHCRSRNGTLASIDSRHESDLLKPFVHKYKRHIWIGLYQSPSGRIRWQDGSAIDFANWFPGEPTDENTELCVETRAQDMSWNDINCKDYELQFICEIAKIIPLVNKTNDCEKKSLVNQNENYSQKSETKTSSEGLSGGVVVLIVCLIFIFIISTFIAVYFWLNKEKNLSESCFCSKIFLTFYIMKIIECLIIIDN